MLAPSIGIGVTALLVPIRIDAPTVFLGRFLVGASFYAADHVVDRHRGGHSEDVIGLGLLAVLVVLGLALTFGGRQISVNPNRSDGPSVSVYQEMSCQPIRSFRPLRRNQAAHRPPLADRYLVGR